MNDESLDRLLAVAQREPPPTVDVAAKVWRQIEQRQSTIWSVEPLTLFAWLSCAAAMVVFFVVQESWSTLSDPLMAIVEPFRMVLP